MLNETVAASTLKPEQINGVTLLRLDNTRLNNQWQEVTQLESCGNAQLDAIALQSAKRFFLRYCDDFTAGELAVVWQAAIKQDSGDDKK